MCAVVIAAAAAAAAAAVFQQCLFAYARFQQFGFLLKFISPLNTAAFYFVVFSLSLAKAHLSLF